MIALIIVGILVVVAAVSLLVRRYGESDRPRSDWTRTDEIFVDPASQRRMRVWLDGTGERHYVPEAAPKG